MSLGFEEKREESILGCFVLVFIIRILFEAVAHTPEEHSRDADKGRESAGKALPDTSIWLEIGFSEGTTIVMKVSVGISMVMKTSLLGFFRPPFVRVSRRLLDLRLLPASGSGEEEPELECAIDGAWVVVRGRDAMSTEAFPNLCLAKRSRPTSSRF